MTGIDTETDKRMLDLAARAAWRGFGLVEPNPMVGCVLTDRAGVVLAIGHHRRFGAPHAEVEAIRSAQSRGASTAGATAWVTLEPCATHGKTPPCVSALLDAGVAQVVISSADPSESGGGAAALSDAGSRVRFTEASTAANRVSAPFRMRVLHDRPWIIAKWAQTVDGRLATGSGDSKWISCETSRRWVHRLRSRVDAVIIGTGTAHTDDPQLTARIGRAPRRVARRIIVDTRLRTPVDSNLVSSAHQCPTTIVTTAESAESGHADKFQDRGVEIVGAAADKNGQVDLQSAMQELARLHTLSNVLLESGPTLLGSFFASGLVDEAAVFVAPRLMADESGQAISLGKEVNCIADARQLMLQRVRRSGDDALLLFAAHEPTA